MSKALLLLPLIFLQFGILPFAFSQDDEKSTLIGNLTDEESGYNIVADSQGNTYVGGLQNKKTLIIKQDASNNVIWSQTLSYTTAVNQFSTLTFLDLVGDTLFGCGKVNQYSLLKGIFYFKMNAQTGVVYWSRYETTSMGYVSCMRYANGKFFLVGGVRPNPQGTNSYTAKVLAVSSQTGNIIWQTPLIKYDIPYAPGSAINSNQFLDATEMVNGKMFITGYVSGHLGGNTNWIGMPLLVGITDTGNLFMERIIHLPYQSSGSNDMKKGSKIRLDMNGDLLIECYTPSIAITGVVPVGNLILIKTDVLGNLIFCKYYRIDNNANVYPQALNETSGSYVLFGTTYSNYGSGSSALKVAKNGDIERCILVSKPNAEHITTSSSFTEDVAGNSSFINGRHYFAVTEITNTVIEPDINKIILDENLGTVGDCSELTELTTSVVDVPITISAGTITHIPHTITVQNGGVWDNMDPFTFCAGISLDLVQNSTCQATVTVNATGFIDPVFYWSNGTSGGNTIPVNKTDTVFVRVLDA